MQGSLSSLHCRMSGLLHLLLPLELGGRPRSTPGPRRSGALRLLLACLLCVGAGARADELADVQRIYYAGQPAAAMERADAFIRSHPNDPPMRFMKGVMLADAGRNADATAVFEQLIHDYPDIPEPYNNLAALQAAAGDYDRARLTLEQALRTNPNYAVAHENLGDVYAALAAQSYDRALKYDPHSVSVPPKQALVRGLYKRAEPASTSASGAPAALGAAAVVPK